MNLNDAYIDIDLETDALFNAICDDFALTEEDDGLEAFVRFAQGNGNLAGLSLDYTGIFDAHEAQLITLPIFDGEIPVELTESDKALVCSGAIRYYARLVLLDRKLILRATSR